jgi:hypothetical protein
LHPAELPADERRSLLREWKEVFDDEELEPLFPQLDRPVHELRDTDRGEQLTRFKLRSVGFDQLRTFEHVLDWAPDQEDNDGGPLTIGWSKLYRRDGVLAHAAIEGGSIGQVTVTRNGKRVAFSSLHPATASEILSAVDRATSRDKTSDADIEDGPIKKGMRVKINRGANRLREGVVFWLGDGSNGPRCGLKTDEDETLWANLTDVKPTTASIAVEEEHVDEEDDDAASAFIKAATPEPPPLAKGTLAKGTKVRWSKGRHSGTGTVFWMGKNKFGEGMRAGVKDDETGETVWADADDCTPV